MNTQTQATHETPRQEELQPDEQRALQYAKNMKNFYEYLITYVVIAAAFLVIFHGEPIVYLVLGGVGAGLIVQGLLAFEVVNFMSADWERKLAERKLGRKL